MEKPPRGRRISTVSLSPLKNRNEMEASRITHVRPRVPKPKTRPSFGVGLSKTETVLVTAAGDVLTSRCRYSSKAYIARNQGVEEFTSRATPQFWWEGPDCHSPCNPCAPHDRTRISSPEGLLGGAAPDLATQYESVPSEITSNGVDTGDKYEVPSDLVSTDELGTRSANVDDLSVLPSFDYSYYAGDGNDMVPNTLNEPLSPLYEEQQSKETIKQTHKSVPRVAPPALMHGVPTFLPAFFQIRITQVSANPLGSHALLISAEALLFSYGLNTNGQLGHGHKSSPTNGSKGFVTTPTYVTPLLENGGKAVVCAAGVDYSLVVVQTEERRLGRLQNRRSFTRQHERCSSDSVMARASSLPRRTRQLEDDESSDDAVESMCHHQLYGFGSNDGMKLGLHSPGGTGKSGSDVLLPRRVALHCKVWRGIEEADEALPPFGIFAVSASIGHSAALVRRATGCVELYTWGDATLGAIDSIRGDTPKSQKNQMNGRFYPPPLAVNAPTLVKSLSSSQKTKGQSTIPVQVALGPTSTFVITTSGQCLSFGKSECGLLGQGDGIKSMVQPGRIVFPSAGNGKEPKIKSISVGARHAVAVALDGRVFAWGKNEGAIMGFDSALRKHLSLRARAAISPSRERLSSLDDEIEWIPREIEIPFVDLATTSRTKTFTRKLSERRLEGAPPRADDKQKGCVVKAYAGIDLTVFVTESGSVLSCGSSSGRLGLGETNSTSKSVVVPTPMFGGLHLWQ